MHYKSPSEDGRAEFQICKLFSSAGDTLTPSYPVNIQAPAVFGMVKMTFIKISQAGDNVNTFLLIFTHHIY
ncbi:MAG: hypothetical protein Q4D94_07700, partial [Bacillota bacterium]|nr:hypothetical protein [Bacillota bacterium]